MAKNTDKSNTTKKEQPTQTEQNPVKPSSPPVTVPFKEPSGELRENVKRGESRQVDTHKNTDK